MEKVLRRSILRRNQLLKRQRRQDEKDLRSEWRQYHLQKQSQQTEMAKYLANERKMRREDWMLGPLAPNRDAGAQMGKFGVVSSNFSRAPALPKRYRKGPRGRGSDAYGSEDRNVYPNGEWKGEGLAGNLVVGDRVVVKRGRVGVVGRIGTVRSVDMSSNTAQLEGVNKADMEIPSYMLANSSQQSLTGIDIPIPIDDLALVVHLEDDETGTNRDFVIEHIYGGAPYQQREPGSNHPRHTRYAMGEDIELPWPQEEIDRQHTRDGDTPRLDVETLTYIPSFDQPPITPAGVIDELRGKYSRDRKLHDDAEWLRRKVIEDARADWMKARTLLQPQKDGQLIAEKRKEQTFAQISGQEEMSEELKTTLDLVAQMQAIKLRNRVRA